MKNTSKLKKFVTYFLATIVLLTLTYHIILAYVDASLANRAPRDVYTSCHKNWATRGLVETGKIEPKWGNSIESISRAFAEKAEGTEVDLYYDAAMGRFIISHDMPYNLKNGQLLTLEELLNAVGEGHYFWLDYKNVREQNDQQTAQAIARLDEVTEKLNMKDRIYIESVDPINLGLYRDAGYHTIFDTAPLPQDDFAASFVFNVYKMAYYFGDFSVMGMKGGEPGVPIYGAKANAILKDVPVFLYHSPNNRETLQTLANYSQVKVIINRDHALNYYDINACQEG